MPDQRLLFAKTGRARFISHLDLMRTFQRAFLRADIAIKHTEGFHPHAFVSIALPLSVGYGSCCEILEFGLLEGTAPEEVPAKLNAVLPEGIEVLSCYDAEKPVKALSWVRYSAVWEYDTPVARDAASMLREMLSRDSLVVQKKSKKAKSGFTEVDIIARIKSWNLECGRDSMTLSAVVSAQNPGLNPELIRSAFCEAYPQFAPDFVSFHRRAVLDEELELFL